MQLPNEETTLPLAGEPDKTSTVQQQILLETREPEAAEAEAVRRSLLPGPDNSNSDYHRDESDPDGDLEQNPMMDFRYRDQNRPVSTGGFMPTGLELQEVSQSNFDSNDPLHDLRVQAAQDDPLPPATPNNSEDNYLGPAGFKFAIPFLMRKLEQLEHKAALWQQQAQERYSQHVEALSREKVLVREFRQLQEFVKELTGRESEENGEEGSNSGKEVDGDVALRARVEELEKEADVTKRELEETQGRLKACTDLLEVLGKRFLGGES